MKEFLKTNKCSNPLLSPIIILLISLAILIFFLFFFREKYNKSRMDNYSCQRNLNMISTALEMYYVDNQSKYPDSLDKPIELYLDFPPMCPLAKRWSNFPVYPFFKIFGKWTGNTYIPSYQVHHNPEIFTIYCKGHHHATEGYPVNYPQYSSLQGLIEP